MSESLNVIPCIARTAKRWMDPDYVVRAEAVERTLEADNYFTEAAIAFAINQQMALLTAEALNRWQEQLTKVVGREDSRVSERGTVAVLNPGNIPFVELQDLVSVLLGGFSYVGTVSSRSPALLPAFVTDLRACQPSLPVQLTSWTEALQGADRVIAAGTDQTMSTVEAAVREHGIPPSRCWLRGHRYSVAVLRGSESNEDLVDLAEDVLLHEGQGCRSVAIIFAPASMSVDPVLDTFAHFRGMFSAHWRTTGPLKMQQAMLQAVGAPHAWADGHAFLISRGDPEVQSACHVRWVPYDDPAEAEEWIRAHQSDLQAVFSSVGLGTGSVPLHPLGTAQRPAVDWTPDGRSHADFFATDR